MHQVDLATKCAPPTLCRGRTAWSLPTALMLVLGLTTRSAIADKAVARVLFDEGMALVEAGRIAEACPKFEESLRQNRGQGTQFRLADCYQRMGRSASAWALFAAVADEAHRLGDSAREHVARARADALVASLSRLTIAVQIHAPDLVLERDGIAIGPALWNTAMPVDPGEHEIVARAHGRRDWSRRVVVPPNGAQVTVEVPDLDRDEGAASRANTQPPPRPASPVPQPRPPSAGTTSRSGVEWTVARWASLGLAVGALAAGTTMLLVGNDRWQASRAAGCDGNSCPDPDGRRAEVQARAWGDGATAAFIVGGVLGAAGITIWVLAPPSAGRHAAVDSSISTVRLNLGPGAFLLQGSF